LKLRDELRHKGLGGALVDGVLEGDGTAGIETGLEVGKGLGEVVLELVVLGVDGDIGDGIA